jgi:hypothetical protein
MKPMVAATVVIVWLSLLTVVLGFFGVRWLLKAPEPELFAEWQGDALQVLGRDGRWMITHLENVSEGTIARLPEPVWVVESGGIRFTAANLAQLKWRLPARGYDEVFSLTSGAAPKTGAEMQVLYFKAWMHALGWSRGRAIEFFTDNAGKAEHDIVVEIDRYLVWPGQALAYKLGELKIKELRAFVEAQAAGSFDVRAFHDFVLGSGALPLEVLDKRVREWAAGGFVRPGRNSDPAREKMTA